MDKTNLETYPRLVEIRKGLPFAPIGAQGFFHGWCKEPFFYDDAGACLPRTYALVEFADGNVRFVEPDWIKFKSPFRQHEDGLVAS
jgi:hypothetical protein